MKHLLLVFIGGGAGAACRHLINIAALKLLGTGFPWGTFTVNILGSFLMGIAIESLALRFSVSTEMRLLIATGFLGGFTTFSAFSLDIALLYQRGDITFSLIYIASSVLLSIAALFAGLTAARNILI